MGFLDKLKAKFTKKEVKTEKQEETKESIKIYEKGLTKSRNSFTSKLNELTNSYHRINEE